MNLQELANEINNLDPNNIGDWPGPIKGVVLLIAFGATIGAGYHFIISDQQDQLARVEAKEDELKREFAEKQSRAANLDAYKAQLEEMERSFGAMLRQLPGKAEIDDLLIDISQSGLAAGLEQDAFVPQGERAQEFYAEVPIQIRLTGDFHQFGEFASSVAALPRIVTLHNISIQPVGGRNADTSGKKLQMEVIAKTYRYLDENEQAAQAAPQTRGGRR
ncbi:MAG: type 4a pilus biogenesis protein PilO [Gammaproteobacteria bacterium]|nr:type 4a pilus biogenesis protein PilO [Gammaproteobacteria bacterium]